MVPSGQAVSRRQLLRGLAVVAGGSVLAQNLAFARQPSQLAAQDDAFLDELERQGSLYFWEQASP